MAKIWLWPLWRSQTVGIAWNELQDILVKVLTQLGVCLCGVFPKFWPWAPKMAQKGPKLPNYDRTLTLSTLLVQHGWNGMEKVTICLGWGFDQVGSVGASPVPNFDPGVPKRANIAQKWTKWQNKSQNVPKMVKIGLLALCNSWNGVEWSWNELLEVQVEV